MIKDDPLSRRAYNAGWAAGEANKLRDVNPFKDGSEQARCWNEGYSNALKAASTLGD